MDLEKKLKKIDVEIEQGLKFKAADRLRNLIQENPNDMVLWDKLAQLYYDSGFFDSAGKYWILIEPENEKIKKCVEIYEKSVNYSGYQILNDLVFRGDKSKLSPYAQNKLSELELDSKNKVNCIPRFAPKRNKKQEKLSEQKKGIKEKFDDMLASLIGFSILGVIVILWIIGLVTVLRWIF